MTTADVPGSFPSEATPDVPGSSPSLATVPSPYMTKEIFSEHDSPLLHQRITSELRRERESVPRKHLRRRRVLVGCLSLAVQLWVAFLTGRYLFAFLREFNPTCNPKSG